jgi:hypothetical protein
MTGGRPPVGRRELGPVLAEASALPSQDGVGRHDDQSPLPAGPDSGQPDPQHAVQRTELRPGHCSLVDGELLARGQFSSASWRRPPHRNGKSRSTWSRRVIIGRDCLRIRADQSTTWLRTEFGEGQALKTRADDRAAAARAGPRADGGHHARPGSRSARNTGSRSRPCIISE